MYSFARHFHREADVSSAQKTKELIIDQGWRYDLGIWFMDTILFRDQLRQLRWKQKRSYKNKKTTVSMQ